MAVERGCPDINIAAAPLAHPHEELGRLDIRAQKDAGPLGLTAAGDPAPSEPAPIEPMSQDGRTVLDEGRVKPDALRLPDHQPRPPLTDTVGRDDSRDGLEPCTIRRRLGGRGERRGKTADVLARGPACGPLSPGGVELLELDAANRPVLRLGGRDRFGPPLIRARKGYNDCPSRRTATIARGDPGVDTL